MCGIAGFLDKTRNENAPVGQTVLTMLNALACRGPDSAGVALYGNRHNGDLVLRVKLGEDGGFEKQAGRVSDQVGSMGRVCKADSTGAYLRLVMDYEGDPQVLEYTIESVEGGIEVVSMGRQLEIVKQVGSPQNLDRTYGISGFVGTHGIGHTRLSTESRVDLSHSQPFWAHGTPDLAIVHNGHITNYHTLRRRYEQRDVRFYTENDSELIGVYLADRLSRGMSLQEVLQASLVDLDGSFSYLVSTPDALGYVRDPFALKPLLYVETDTFVAVATEEIAVRSAFEGVYDVEETPAKDVRLWQT